MGLWNFLNTNAAGIGAVMPMLQLPLQAVQSYQNYNLQKENLAYQKAIQQKIFDREDTAIQRRVADLKAAGLNPLLAAGSGAGTGSYVPTVAPQIQPMDMMTPLATAQSMLESKSRIDSSSVLTSAQVDKIRQDIKESDVRIDKNKEEISLIKLEKEFKREDINRIIKATGLLLEQIASTKQERELQKEIYDFNRNGGFRSLTPMSEPLQLVMSIAELLGYHGSNAISLIDKGASTFYNALIQALQSTGFIKK